MWGGWWNNNPNARAIILAQLYELATNYGKIPYFWIDMMNWAPKDLPTQEVYDLLKSINPETIVIMNQHVQDGTKINYFPTDILNGEKLISSIEDADIPAAILQLEKDQVVYQAALKTGAQLISVSLLNYL